MTAENKLFDLTGRTAVVTGGGGILGTGFCKVLAAHGARVAVLDVNLQAAEEAVQSIHSTIPSAKLQAYACNVADPVQVQQTVADIVGRFGGVDILHNNAATKTSDLQKFFEPFETYELATWREIMSVNIDGMFLMAQAVGKQMLAQGRGGSIIQTASVYGVVAPDLRRLPVHGARHQYTSSLLSVQGCGRWPYPVPGKLLGRTRHPREHLDAGWRRERAKRGLQQTLFGAGPAGPNGAGGRDGISPAVFGV